MISFILTLTRLSVYVFEFIGLLSPFPCLINSARLYVSKRSDYKYSGDWTLGSSIRSEATASDVIAPSPWKIFGCQNGKNFKFFGGIPSS